MYDKLVKRLRERAEAFDYDGWVETASDYEKAADAIEKLGDWWAMAGKLMKMLEMPRWIPVTERLPEEWFPVLGLIQYHDEKEPPTQQVLWYLGNGHWRETWRGDMIESNVTHWMPLPEPPKEERA